MENQTLFQALPSSSSGAADVQGSSKALPSNLHVRTANLLTLCHSLTYAAHKPHTHTHCVYVYVQKRTRHRHRYMHKIDIEEEKHKIDFEQETYFRTPFLISLSVHFSAEGTQFLFSSLSFPSVQQLGKIQHALADSENSFI